MSLLMPVAAGVVGTLTGIAVAAKAGTVAFSAHEQALSRLNAVYRATSGVVGITSRELQNLARNMQQTTIFSDEAVMAAEAILLTFTRIRGDNFERAIELAGDMSVALGKDLAVAVQQLGVAMQDPIKGLGRLRRAGVSFTTEEERMIISLAKAGKEFESHSLLLDVLQTKFGGVAAAQLGTWAGQWKQIGNIFQDTRKQIGQFFVLFLEPLLPVLRDLLVLANSLLRVVNAIAWVLTVPLRDIAASWRAIISPVVDLIDWMTNLVDITGEYASANNRAASSLRSVAAGSTTGIEKVYSNIQASVLGQDVATENLQANKRTSWGVMELVSKFDALLMAPRNWVLS